MTNTTTGSSGSATPRATTLRCAGAATAAFLVVISVAQAQVTLHPDEPLARDLTVSSPFSGLGGGAEGPDVAFTADSPRPAASPPGFIAWERWWHLRLYGELAARAPQAAPLDEILRDDVVRALQEALEGGGDLERSAAAMALGRAGASGAVADLVFALEGAAPEVQQSIVLALGMVGHERSRTLLDALARDARFGRRSLGDRTVPVPAAVRVAAIVGIGHLAPRRDETTLRDLIVGGDVPDEVRLAACIAIGLRPVTDEPRPGRVRGSTECERHAADLRRVLADEGVASECRAALFTSFARVAPHRADLVAIACSWLASEDARLARAAANACALLDDRTAATRTALWSRVADPVDMVASGMALIALSTRTDDSTFARLTRLDDLPRALRPYAAFGLLEASAAEPDRVRASRDAVRRWMATETDHAAGAACIVLGLLGAEEDRGGLSQLVSRKVSSRARGAAILGLGLLGEDATGDATTPRPSPLEAHDRLIAAALSRRDCRELVEALRKTRDAYVLGGCARAIALCGDAAAPSLLLELLEDEDDESVRAFAVGALGLLLDADREFGLEQLRDASPLPVDSPSVMRVLAHL